MPRTIDIKPGPGLLNCSPFVLYVVDPMAGYETYHKLHYHSSMFADDSEFSPHIVEKIVEARESPNVTDTDLVYTGVDCQWLNMQ